MNPDSPRDISREFISASAIPATGTTGTTITIKKLFEFHPDGDDRPPNGPGMYTWWARRLASNANLTRIHRRASVPAVPPGLAGGLIFFPDDISEEIIHALVLRAHERLAACNGVQVSSYHAFQGAWRQGSHSWSIRSFAIDIAGVFREDFFETAKDLLRCAKCEYAVLRHEGAMYVVSEHAEAPRGRLTSIRFWFTGK